MTVKTLIVPRAGLKLRDPLTGQPVPAEGIVVTGRLSVFWHRLKKSGDVEALQVDDAPASSTIESTAEPLTTDPADATEV
ncbi:DUF2635 domain-containing protein [Nannocystis pusilla]|uniref:DUF2635 domain-containing protein n=1 Tax=Nannocystis pusilla TaxID=889268 RepID=A0A9X3ERG9_9BACT|nr:DUF2635 domain-containing protein [Nannocystis pusilla]MCY1003996.1 DUF2635 domain-containing protein [Nannocystis pusilla]MCY1008521.1 DUF2635 domain-containing protein [Nannocystis pusilla]